MFLRNVTGLEGLSPVGATINAGAISAVKISEGGSQVLASVSSYVALLVVAFGYSPLNGQNETPGLPAFEVASVKPEAFVIGPGNWNRPTEVTCSNDRLRARSASPWFLIKWAWDIVAENERLVSYPDWIGDVYYDVEAKASSPVSQSQCRLMLRTLLVERFMLREHEEARLLDAFDLVIAKGGPKITRITDPNAPPNGPGFTIGGHEMQMRNAGAKGWTMEELADSLTVAQLGRKVFDRTGLKGIYRIDLKFHIRGDDSGEGPDVTTALREQLGLELKPAKERLNVVVVDHIERPSQN